MHFFGVSGSIRPQSTNTQLLHALADHAPNGVSVEVYEQLGLHPIFDPDLPGEDYPAIISTFIDRINAADGLIIAAPEYAHGIPGGLKNALDWLVSDANIPHKPVMLVHASTRSDMSRQHLREVLKTMSLAVYDGPEFERSLIKNSPEDILAMFATTNEQKAVSDCLNAFAKFCASSAQKG